MTALTDLRALALAKDAELLMLDLSSAWQSRH